MDHWQDITSGDYMNEFERRQSGPVYAVPTMFPTWNDVSGGDGGGGGRGLARGWTVLVGGNPGFGKTLLALLLARQCIQTREKTAFVSMEMHHAQLASRFYALATETETRRLEKGRFDPEAMGGVRTALRRLFPTGGLRVNTKPLFRLSEVLSAAKALVQDGTKALIVDYLQLIGIGDEESINRQVTEAITGLRAFALEHQVLVVALSQFNRTTSANREHTPRIQGLSGGGIIEQCADQALLLDHSRYERDPLHSHIARTYAVLDKNKHGDRIEIPILWDYRTLTAREGLDDEKHEWPTHTTRS